MKVSPSIASSDVLNIQQEVDFADQYFNNIHLDIEDGVAVNSMSFGMKMCKRICDYSKSEEITIHLEVHHPLDYLKRVKECRADVVFLQVDHLFNPIENVKMFLDHGIPTGVNISNEDLFREELPILLDMVKDVLVNTTYHKDAKQVPRKEMIEFAINLANKGQHRVWIDGGINYEIYQELKDSKIYAAVMGRAVFGDKNLAIERFTK